MSFLARISLDEPGHLWSCLNLRSEQTLPARASAETLRLPFVSFCQTLCDVDRGNGVECSGVTVGLSSPLPSSPFCYGLAMNIAAVKALPQKSQKPLHEGDELFIPPSQQISEQDTKAPSWEAGLAPRAPT